MSGPIFWPGEALSLPTEILCTIFVHASLQDPLGLRHDGLHWIASVTHVCQRWRDAAIGCSELWAGIICAFPSDAATDCLLARAQSRHLTFTVRVEEDVPDQFGDIEEKTRNLDLSEHQFKLAEQNLVRLRVFEHPGAVSASFAKALISTPPSHLTVLRLRLWEGANEKSLVINEPLKLPMLREIYLDSVFFVLDAPLLLVCEVANHYGRDFGHLEDPPSLALLATLKTTPLLERLALDHICALLARGDMSDLPEELESINLPHMRTISFIDVGMDLFLYKHLCVPPEADVSIENFDNLCNPNVDCPALFATVKDHLRHPQYDTLIVLEDKDTDGYTHVHIRLRRQRSRRMYDALEGEAEFRLDVCINPMAIPMDTCQILHALMPYLDIGEILHLDFSEIGTNGYIPVDDAAVRAAITPFANVRTLLINHRHLMALCREDGSDSDSGFDFSSSSEHSSERGSIDPSELPLPELDFLIVQNITNGPNLTYDSLVEAWEAVFQVITERIRARGPLLGLTVDEYQKFSSCKAFSEEYRRIDHRDWTLAQDARYRLLHHDGRFRDDRTVKASRYGLVSQRITEYYLE